MTRAPRIAIAACSLLLAACGRAGHPIDGASAASSPAPAPSPPPSSAAAPPQPAQPAAPDAGGWRWLVPPPARPTIEQVAALRADRALAVGGGRLYQLAGDRWAEVPVPSGEPRAVAAGEGALWALAKGVGDRAGHTLIFRVAGAAGPTLAASAALGPAHEPRALAVAAGGGLYVGGEAPALARITPAGAAPVPLAEPRVTALDRLADGSVVAAHAPDRLTLLRAGAPSAPIRLEPGAAALIGGGEIFRVRSDQRLVPGLDAAPADAPPAPVRFRPAAAGRTADGRPVVLGPGGAAGAWRTDRSILVHTNEPGGARAYFNEPQAPDWEPIAGAVPRDPIAVLRTAPPLLAGRDGALSTLERDGDRDVARAVVEVPYPRALALVPLRDGATLLAGERAILRVDASGARRLALPADAQAWLEAAARPGVWSRRTIQAIACRAGEAVLATTGTTQALRVRGVDAAPVELGVEPLGLGCTPEGDWIAALVTGAAVRGGAGGPARSAGTFASIAPDQVAHVTGAFTGRDGRTRIAALDLALACADPGGLAPCGPAIAVRPRRAWPLHGGLLVETQQIDTRIVDERGARAVPNLRGPEPIAYAGAADAPYALRQAGAAVSAGYEVMQLRGGAWEHVAGIPAACLPQAFAVTGAGVVLVGCEGEAILVGPPGATSPAMGVLAPAL